MKRKTGAGFPWLPATLAATLLAAAAWVGVSLAWVHQLGGSARFFWDAFIPGPHEVMFIGSEQFRRLELLHRLRQILLVVTIVSAASSTWAFRQARRR